MQGGRDSDDPTEHESSCLPRDLNKTSCSPPCRSRCARVFFRSRRPWRCRSARCFMNPAVNCTTFIFPPRSSCSLLYVKENGASAENAVVGNEGLLGILLFMGGETTQSRAVVRSAGQGFQKTQKHKKKNPHTGQAM